MRGGISPPTRRRHSCMVFYRNRPRDWFRRSWWVGCWYCGGVWGPYNWREANNVAADLWGDWRNGSRWCNEGARSMSECHEHEQQ